MCPRQKVERVQVVVEARCSALVTTHVGDVSSVGRPGRLAPSFLIDTLVPSFLDVEQIDPVAVAIQGVQKIPAIGGPRGCHGVVAVAVVCEELL
jgi:hypothetical protein